MPTRCRCRNIASSARSTMRDSSHGAAASPFELRRSLRGPWGGAFAPRQPSQVSGTARTAGAQAHAV
eukprot:2689988-Pyramimonas_sp.AAC.1